MRRHARSLGSFLLVAAMAAVAGCSDDPRVNADGGAGKGGSGAVQRRLAERRQRRRRR